MQEPAYKSITPGELKKKLDGGEEPVLLDVREPWEFALSRIAGSRLVPMAEILDDVTGLDRETETIVYLLCFAGYMFVITRPR